MLVSKQKIVLFQGDSITDGNRQRAVDSDVQYYPANLGHSFTNFIAARLGRKFRNRIFVS